MSNSRTNKHQRPTVQTVVVSSTAAIATTAENIVGTGNAYNIANGQLTVLSASNENTRPYGYKIAAGDVAGTNCIEIAQGTPLSNNMSAEHTMKAGHRSLVRTDKIYVDKVTKVSCKKPELGTYEVERVVFNGTPANDTLYRANLKLNSVNFDGSHGALPKNIAASHGTASGETSSKVLHNIAAKLNRQSNESLSSNEAPFVIFGLASAAVGTSTLLSTIQEGTSIPFLISGGVTHNYIANKDFVNTFTKIHASGTVANTNYLVAIDAVTNPVITGLIVVGLDHQAHYGVDLETRKKVKVDMGMGSDATVTILSRGFEGTGIGSTLKVVENERSLLQVNNYNMFPTLSHNVSTTSYVDGNLLYTETLIEHNDEVAKFDYPSEHKKKVVILWPATVTNPTAAVGTAYTISSTTTGALAAANAVLAPWFNRNSGIEYLGDAVKNTTIIA